VLLTEYGRRDYYLAWGIEDGFMWQDLDMWYGRGEVERPLNTFVYIDKSGEVLLGPFERPPFSYMALSERWNMVNCHMEAVAFRNGLAKSFEGLLYGFINKDGVLVTARDYYLVNDQRYWNRLSFVNDDGLALAAASMPDINHSVRMRYVYIDVEGNEVTEFEAFYWEVEKAAIEALWLSNYKGDEFGVRYYKEVGDFALAMTDEYGGYINMEGEWIVRVRLFADNG
jgi:hypothetical protein